MMGGKTSGQDARSSVPQPLTRALTGCRKGLYAAGLFSLFESILLLVVPFYSFQVFHRVLTSRSENTLLMMTIFAVGPLIFLALLNGMLAQVISRVELSIDAHLSGAPFPPHI